MNEKRILELACARLGVDMDSVLSHRVYEDHIALVVDRGIAGCPKYSVALGELKEPEVVVAPNEPKEIARPKRARRSKQP